MRIEQLIYLIELSHSRSLNLAAEALHISTQALSASMKNLETELCTTILVRSNRGVTFTESGQKVLQYAHHVVNGYYSLLDELAPQSVSATPHSSLNGTLHLLSAPAFLESFIPSKIQEFQQQYPHVNLSVTQCSTREICTNLQNSTTPSLGLVLLPCNKDTLFRQFIPEGEFTFRPINISRFVCCVAKDSPFARHKTISIKKVLKHPLVIYTTGSGKNSPLLYQLHQFDVQPQVASVVSSINFWAKSIKNHLGIGFLNEIFLQPQSMVKDAFDDLIFIKLTEPLLTLNGFIYTGEPAPLLTTFMNQFPAFHPTKNDPVFCKEIISL